jgi:uncharacterized protein with HEPN domain
MKTSRVGLEIVLKEINFILDNIYSSSESLFENDPLIQRATVLSLIIIGEEASKINKAIKKKYNRLPWELMSGMRNKMVHNYDGIDTAIVWKTVKDDIPGIKNGNRKYSL